MKRTKRVAEYEGWKIEAPPTILANQRLFVSGVIVSRGEDRFIFTDLGNRVYRAQLANVASSGRSDGSTIIIGTVQSPNAARKASREGRWQRRYFLLATFAVAGISTTSTAMKAARSSSAANYSHAIPAGTGTMMDRPTSRATSA